MEKSQNKGYNKRDITHPLLEGVRFLEKRRVYQVAKEQKLSSDALISMLKGMDIDVKSHMSVVTPDMLEAINR